MQDPRSGTPYPRNYAYDWRYTPAFDNTHPAHDDPSRVPPERSPVHVHEPRQHRLWPDREVL